MKSLIYILLFVIFIMTPFTLRAQTQESSDEKLYTNYKQFIERDAATNNLLIAIMMKELNPVVDTLIELENTMGRFLSIVVNIHDESKSIGEKYFLIQIVLLLDRTKLALSYDRALLLTPK